MPKCAQSHCSGKGGNDGWKMEIRGTVEAVTAATDRVSLEFTRNLGRQLQYSRSPWLNIVMVNKRKRELTTGGKANNFLCTQG